MSEGAATPDVVVGAWHWDIAQDRVLGTPGLYAIFGLDPAVPRLSATSWNAAILPEDRPAYEQAVRVAIDQQTPLSTTYRIRRMDGSVRLLRDQGQVLVDNGRRSPVMFGSTQDVTDLESAWQMRDESLRRLRTVMDATPDIICLKDAQGRWLEANTADLKLFGLENVDYRGRTDAELADEALSHFREAFMQCEVTDRAAWELGRPSRGREDIPDQGGGVRHYDVLKVPLFDEQGKPSSLVVYGRDNTDLESIMEALAERESLLRTIMNASPDFMLIKDADSRWQLMNRAGEELYRLQGQDWHGRTDMEIAQLAHAIYSEGLAICSDSDEQAWQARQLTREVEIVPLPEGGKRVFDVIKVPLFDAAGERRHLVVLGRDVTARAEAEARLEHAALHDALTGLANRAYFIDRLNQRLTQLGDGQRLAIIFLDLDHFKSLNDTYGHHVGDALLQQVAFRYRTALREGDLLARLGGDEFVVLLDNLSSCAEAEDVAQRLIDSLSAPVDVDALSLYITGSAGISLAPLNSGDAGTLMMYADSAMYRAKEMGRNTYAVYQGGMNDRSSERLLLLGDLRRALDEDALAVHFQPQLNARTFEVESVEALARWYHPTLGAIPPDRFIVMAEESGLINALGQRVLRETCRQLRDWRDRLGCSIRGAVNVSPVQLQHPDFVRQVVMALKEFGLPPQQLEIEITESALLRDPERALAALRELRVLGVSVALDDFGTGYSSLSYLKRFPFDRIKIDRTFVRDILTDTGDLAIVKATIAMGHSLGLQVVAEGVEYMEQRTRLEALGCDLLQGYLLGRPAPAAEIDGLFGQSFL